MGSLAITLCHLAAGRVDGVVSLKAARSVDIAAAQLLVREQGLAIDLPDEPPFGTRAARPRRAFTRRRGGQRRAVPTAGGRAHAVRIGCSGWNYDHWRHGVVLPTALCRPHNWLAYLRTALRHRRGEHDVLPLADGTDRAALGARDDRPTSPSLSRSAATSRTSSACSTYTSTCRCCSTGSSRYGARRSSARSSGSCRRRFKVDLAAARGDAASTRGTWGTGMRSSSGIRRGFAMRRMRCFALTTRRS